MQQVRAYLLDTTLLLPLLAVIAAGLLIGIERGWRQRGEPDGLATLAWRACALWA